LDYFFAGMFSHGKYFSAQNLLLHLNQGWLSCYWEKPKRCGCLLVTCAFHVAWSLLMFITKYIVIQEPSNLLFHAEYLSLLPVAVSTI
jgi:hypothetical protein